MKQDDLKSIKDIIAQLDEIELENINAHEKDEKSIIFALENSIYKFSVLSLCLMEKRGNRSIKLNYIEIFITAIANNSVVIKKLFMGGWHLQCQSIMRVQYEQLNVVLSIIFDDDFFKKFHTIQEINDEEIPVSPKHKDTKRILKKFLEKKNGKAFWDALSPIMEFIYKEFSRAIHNNFLHVVMLSSNKDKDDIFRPGIGGNQNCMDRMRASILQMNNYSQIIYSLIQDILIDLDAIDNQNQLLKLEIMKSPLIIKV